MIKKILISTGIVLAMGCTMPAIAQNDNYPDKPIKIVVPYPPGGFNDTLARTVANKLHTALGQPVIVDNKPGGGTVIGINAVAKAPPDGYTIAILPFAFAVNPYILANLPYDSEKDIAPITMAATTANVLVVPASSKFNTMAELIAGAKAKPGSLSYASAGNGSSNHLSMEKFKQLAGVSIVHIPYRGSGPAIADLLGGQIDVMFENISNVLPHIKSGKLKALAVTTAKRSQMIPELPTVSEAGVRGFEVGVWFGIGAPSGTPKKIIDKLNAEIVKILHMPDVKQQFAAQGVDSVGSSPADFQTHLQSQRSMWSKVVKDAGVKPE